MLPTILTCNVERCIATIAPRVMAVRITRLTTSEDPRCRSGVTAGKAFRIPYTLIVFSITAYLRTEQRTAISDQRHKPVFWRYDRVRQRIRKGIEHFFRRLFPVSHHDCCQYPFGSGHYGK